MPFIGNGLKENKLGRISKKIPKMTTPILIGGTITGVIMTYYYVAFCFQL
jgi:hypothetical protein